MARIFGGIGNACTRPTFCMGLILPNERPVDVIQWLTDGSVRPAEMVPFGSFSTV
jgi:hypothetical protein